MSLDDRIIVEVELSTLMAGTGTRGALAERLGQLKADVLRAEGRVVLFFDEIHAPSAAMRATRRRAS